MLRLATRLGFASLAILCVGAGAHGFWQLPLSGTVTLCACCSTFLALLYADSERRERLRAEGDRDYYLMRYAETLDELDPEPLGPCRRPDRKMVKRANYRVEIND